MAVKTDDHDPNGLDFAPAVLDGDPALLFSDFPTYDRAAMTIEGYRQIVGDETFFAVARAIQIRFRYGNLSTADFVRFANAYDALICP